MVESAKSVYEMSEMDQILFKILSTLLIYTSEDTGIISSKYMYYHLLLGKKIEAEIVSNSVKVTHLVSS